MARDPQRRTDTRDGDSRQPQKSVVDMSLWPCLESGHLLARGRAALRLPHLRRQNESKNDVNPARGDGQKIKKTLGGNNMKRRLLSIFLSLTMILSMVPSVWAADEMRQDDPAAQETETPAKPAMNGNCGADDSGDSVKSGR